MASVDGHTEGKRIVGGDQGRGESRERRQADRWLARGKGNAASGRDADAKAGEAPGPGRHRNAIKISGVELCASEHALDQWHQGFGVTALHGKRFLGTCIRVRGVEYSDRTRLESSIDGKDAHSESVCDRPQRAADRMTADGSIVP
jgi:hypothetical protein